MNKKCIVLDLDNTLWGGVIGEDGINGIELGMTGRGAGFVAFQQALLDLYNNGILLAINSRNNESDVRKVFSEHPNMILKDEHFVVKKINWDDKAQNIIEIAKELNIGTDSLVFFDDDPANRSWVQKSLPEVEVPDFPLESSELVPFLVSLPYFNLKTITDEDKMRGNLYVTERLRREMEKGFTDKTDFLKSLKLELHVTINDVNSVARLSQLTEKTNQFNLNKNPINEEEMQSLMGDDEYLVFSARTVDIFGDHGITNLAIIHKNGSCWIIEQYLMSCRVISKGIEDAFLFAIATKANADGVDSLKVLFKKTEKNVPAQDFYDRIKGAETIRINELTKPGNIKITIK